MLLNSYFRVFAILGVFSESTASALEFYAKENPGLVSTSKFVKCILNIWKIMCVRTPEKSNCQLAYRFFVSRY